MSIVFLLKASLSLIAFLISENGMRVNFSWDVPKQFTTEDVMLSITPSLKEGA